ncbi:MAG TPA: PBP1A family penicillin-binding protein [Candidatus Polarisedimenticolia bacterium]|nr:PBP1A family penicillin-binding protein [Candidatus Polarisedimenticolia bacterium]
MAARSTRRTGKKRAGPSRRALLWGVPVAGLALVAGALTIAFIDVNWRFSRLASPPPIRVLSTSFHLREGMRLSREDLVARLQRLGYRQVEGQPSTPGEYSLRFRSIEISRNRFDGPDGPVEPLLVRVRLGSSRVGNVEDAETGRDVIDFRLEPEPLGFLSGDAHEERRRTPIADVPAVLKRAVIAVEDRRFLRHPGFDPLGILRAFFANLREGEVVQGGSTITQQLAKNLYHAGDRRTVPRKIWETLAAISLEMARTKDAILERYLNEVYLAQRGPMAIVGVGAAAQHYFGKEVRYLDLPEAALLAGLIQSPGHYHPYRHPDAAHERRDLVLGLMRDAGFITEDERQAAAAAPLRLRPEPSHDPRQAPYFVDYIAEELRRVGIDDDSSSGLTVFTTLDPLLQARAERALESRLAKDEKNWKQLRPLPGGSLQGALVALRPADGAIVAMVGGRDYGSSQFNRVAQAHRQPGSLFKPFVYLAGFQRAQEEGEASFTPATVLDDSPLEEVVAGKLWAPHNFDEEFRGPVTVRQALTHSLNIPTIRAAEQIGLREVIRAARRCGIESPLEPVPSIALGTFEVTPLEIAAAFSTFANAGERQATRAIEAVVDGRGKRRELPAPERRRATTPQAAYLTIDLMRDVVRQGTAASLGAWGFEGDLAGKTGTTDEGRDAWFVGFNRDLLALAWVGFDNNRPLRLEGSALALPIWADFAAGAGLDPQSRFEEPEGLVREQVDPTTGLLAGWRCPDSLDELFIEGSAPVDPCEHDKPFTSWAKRLFHWLKRE